LGFEGMGWAWAADRRLRDLPSFAGRVKLGAAATHRDRVGIGNKKPRHMGGAAAGCCWVLLGLSVFVSLVGDKLEVGPIVEDLKRSAQLVEVGTLAGCGANVFTQRFALLRNLRVFVAGLNP